MSRHLAAATPAVSRHPTALHPAVTFANLVVGVALEPEVEANLVAGVALEPEVEAGAAFKVKVF